MQILRNFLFSFLLLLLFTLYGCAGAHHRGASQRHGPRPVTTCFYNFTEIYQSRIYPTLSEAPGVTTIERQWSSCRQPNPCLCYILTYDGPIDELSAIIRQRLPVNKAVPFRCLAKGPDRLEVTFDSGFK